ncbi:MAG TPA: FG-GAP-like repeat-containing protein [Candidatus Saccharimonadales bacterium]
MSAELFSHAQEQMPGGVGERMRAAALKIGARLVAAAVIVTGGTVAFAAQEIARPALAYADDLSYPWHDAPCKFGSNGGASCANPDDQSDVYNWGIVNADGSFSPYRNGYEYRNCTDYVQWKVGTYGASVPGNLGNGGRWYDNSPAEKRTVTPKAGEAAVVPGTLGHVAFVEAVNTDGTITVSEYNHNKDGTGDKRTGKPADMGFTEFIDFGVDSSKVQPPSSPAPAPRPPYKQADFTHDGKSDIAWFEKWKNTVSILRSDGNGFAVQSWQTGIGGPDWAGVGDFDGNGFADVAWYEKWKNRITVMINHGNNTFSLEDFMDGVGAPVWAGVGDFDGDGKDDLAWYERPANTITILRSNNGRFSGWARLAGIGAASWAGVGDFDGDKKADIAWYEGWKAAVTVFSGGKNWASSVWRSGIGGPDWAGVGDFDGDHRDDIAWYEGWKSKLSMLHSEGSALSMWGGLDGLGGPGWAGTGDFTGDGKADIAWYEPWKQGITVLKSNEPGGFSPSMWLSGVGGPDWAGPGGPPAG